MNAQSGAHELLEAAWNGEERCLAHGHKFDVTGRTPCIVESDHGPEVWCVQCADHYEREIVLEVAEL